MNTIEKVKNDLEWSHELDNFKKEGLELFESVDAESYNTLEEIEEEFGDDALLSFDVDFVSVLESFSECLSRINWINFYYLSESRMYAGIMTYDA